MIALGLPVRNAPGVCTAPESRWRLVTIIVLPAPVSPSTVNPGCNRATTRTRSHRAFDGQLFEHVYPCLPRHAASFPPRHAASFLPRHPVTGSLNFRHQPVGERLESIRSHFNGRGLRTIRSAPGGTCSCLRPSHSTTAERPPLSISSAIRDLGSSPSAGRTRRAHCSAPPRSPPDPAITGPRGERIRGRARGRRRNQHTPSAPNADTGRPSTSVTSSRTP